MSTSPVKIVSIEELQKEIEKVYLIKDPYIVELLMAYIIAHFISGDPVWIVIVAPSGGGKSEFINMIYKIKWTPPGPDKEEQKVHALSTLSPKTFISGAKAVGRDTSLLLQISNGIITLKDFTSILSMQKDDRGEIMGQLREIYDGKYAKSFGTGETIEWSGKISVLAGSTYSIHELRQSYAAMGERFMFYELEQPAGKDAARKTMENQEEGMMAAHREKLATMFGELGIAVLDAMKDNEQTKITKEQREDTLDLAELATRARSNVRRNYYSREQEIENVDPPEMPTRFAGQLQQLMRALKILNQYRFDKPELTADNMKLIAKIALNSVTRSRHIAMIELAKYDVITTSGIAVKLGLPTNTVRRWLEELVALDVAEREKGSGSKGDRWKIKPSYQRILQRFEGIVHEGAELTEKVADPNAKQEEELPPFEFGDEELHARLKK